MRRRFLKSLVSGVVGAGLVSWWPRPARAGFGLCSHCGHQENCHKFCRLVCEERKITTVCWGVRDEEFCIPGPTRRGCEHCDTVCGDRGCDDRVCGEYAASTDLKGVSSGPKKRVWTEWIPGRCAGVATKRKLMKRVVTKTVPSYKWVVEDLCAACESRCEPTTHPPDAVIPPPPAVEGAKLLPGTEKPSGKSK